MVEREAGERRKRTKRKGRTRSVVGAGAGGAAEGRSGTKRRREDDDKEESGTRSWLAALGLSLSLLSIKQTTGPVLPLRKGTC